MEFWGVEVKQGAPLHVDPGVDMLVHISQAALGENKNNVNEPIKLYLRVKDKKHIIGVLSHDKIPQLATEIVLERNFELSHSWKNGSVFFSGYKVDASDPENENMTDDGLAVASNEAVAKSGVKQVNFQLPNEDVQAKQDDDDDDSEDDSSDDDDDDSSEESGDEEEKTVTAEGDSDEDDSSDDDEEDSSEEDTPIKPEEPKKRSAEANSSKNTASNKKAKFVTPQKSESKKPHVHVATPHPSKQAGKNSGGSSNGESLKQQQTPKSPSHGCKSCTRSFTSEMALQSHTKAKHSAAA
ncbi:histone deacetylase HDT3 isoform X2 [Capsella rubella]|uniref:histone deacetylase HDT3 isoform X2 n=1 Tax=Capsella rubella TaxID=81985 RepID=UPI000CD5C256|nr:histone deacetylase HDT3 isoform X2 [Capsella rubella]